MRNKAKILGTIIGILSFVTLMAGITYAWYNWSTNAEEETLIATEVGTVTVKYDAGPSIIGKKIKPVSDKSLGIIKGITVSADSQNVNETVFDLYLDIELLDDGLKHASFKYELYESNNLLSYGNFANLITEECNNDSTVNHIVLLSEEEITTSLSNYVLYIWIDGNVENPSSMQSQDFEFTLHAVGKNAIGEEALYPDITVVQEGTLAYKIVNDYLSSNNKVMALNHNVRYYYDIDNSLMSDIAGNVRYYGNNPNNYIYFNCDTYPETNCEKWRIIGVFDDKVKLIRNQSLGLFSWDYNYEYTGTVNSYKYNNDWNEASIQKLLNGAYLNNENTIYYNYSSSDPIELNFNSTGTGIKNNTKNLIANTQYNLGGFSGDLLYVDETYKQERGITQYDNNLTFWTGKIALIHPSDYWYSTNLGLCKALMNSPVNSVCTQNNWMSYINPNYSWALNPDATHWSFASSVGRYGNVYYGLNVYTAYNVFPVLYLNANTVISNVGNGSEGNPHRLIVNQ